MYRIVIHRIFRSLGALRVLAAVLVAAMLASGLSRATPARAATPSCQGPCQTYPLLNLSGLFAASDAQTASLQNLEQQAMTNTISDHQLPASDAAAVLTWGRDDAEAELWGLIVQAIQTPAASRTADQQNAVDWLSGVQLHIKYDAAVDAGMEYTKFAGFDPGGFSQLAYGGADQNTLANYLCAGSGGNCGSGPQYEPYYPSESKATGGYCTYTSPDGSFSDSTNQTCYTGCTSILGCTPAVPTSDQLTQWGEDDENNALSAQYFATPAFAQMSHEVAIAPEFFGTLAGAGVTYAGLSQGLAGVFYGSKALSQALVPNAAQVYEAGAFSAEPGSAAEEAALAAADTIYGETVASSIGFIASVVIAAVTTAVLQGINVFSAANLPGVLAGNIVSARTSLTGPPPDLSADLADTNGAQTLYGLFIAATLPGPDALPPIPAPALSDPMFAIQARGATTTTDAESLSLQEGTTQTVDITARLSGTWFVEQLPAADGSTTSAQSLHIDFTDWSGVQRIAWLLPNGNGNGYQFVVIQDPSASSSPPQAFDPSTCGSDGACSVTSSIDYVGSDGNDYSASVVPYQAPTVTWTASPNPVEGTPQNFSASATSPLGQSLTYQWRFEQPTASGICGGECGGSFSAPVSGANVSYVWPTSGAFHVQLTATDSFDRTQVDTFTVTVGDAPPTLALNPTGPVSLGQASTLAGTITRTGSADTENVTVNWGDGASDTVSISSGGSIQIITGSSSPITVTNASSAVVDLSDTHTYASPGVYIASVSVQDQSGAKVTATTTELVQGGPQTITFAPVPDHTYGDAPVFISATGGASGQPVTFSADPSRVCSISSLGIGTDTNGDAAYTGLVTLHAAGTCTVTANQDGTRAPGGVSIYPPAEPVMQTFQVNPAPLTITADDKSMTYGGTAPTFTAHYQGLVNGDTGSAVTGLSCGAKDASGNPVTGSTPAGSYTISCSGGSAANYTITSYKSGTLTINPAPLTITADDQTTPYGQVPKDTWTGTGWVNGESAGTLSAAPNSAPTCSASVNGSPELATTPPGVYAGAITCAGAVDPNYAFSYKSGQLTVDPLLSLDEQGLPGSVPHRATLDGQTVSLPDSNVAVPYGSSHSYSFPAEVTDSSGTVYFTTDRGFSGAVTANITDTAVYQTMAQIVSAALSSGGIDDGGIANSLTQQFAAVQADIQASNTSQALTDLQSFASHVRAQSGQHLTAATVQALLAAAQLVYANLGGTGTV